MSKRFVQPTELLLNTSTTSSVHGVWVDDDETVEWFYMYLPDGKKVATGYEIQKIGAAEESNSQED